MWQGKLGITKGRIPRDDEHKLNQPPMYKDWKTINNGNRCHPGCRLNLLFHNKSAGEGTFLVKSIVHYSDELNHKIGLKLSRK